MHTKKSQTPELPSSYMPHRLVKVKVKTAPLHTVKVHMGGGGVGSIPILSLVLGIDGGEWSPSWPDHYIPGERAPGTPWIGGWVGLKAILHYLKEKKSLLPLLEVEWRLLGCTFRSLFTKGTALYRLFNEQCFLITNLWTFGKRSSSIRKVEQSPPWRTALLRKIRLYYQIKKLLAFYGKRTSLPAESRSVYLVTWIQHTPYNSTYLISTLVIHWFIIRLGLQCGVSSIHIT
jgi:hypothetical protein